MRGYERALEDEKYNRQHGYIFSLMILDFFLTYIGIRFYEVIQEGNPFLVWTFELPLFPALLLRIFYASIVVLFAHYMRLKQYPYHPQFVTFALTANALVMFLHFRWVIQFLISHL